MHRDPPSAQPDARERPARNRTEGRLRLRAGRSGFARRVGVPTIRRLRIDETAGWPVILAGIAALLWANSPWGSSYEALWSRTVALDLGAWRAEASLRDLVDLLLLPLFFFTIAVEIRAELTHGHLSELRRAALPVAAAIGGMAVPIAVYLAWTRGTPAQSGFGVPVATDIAFALAFLLVLGDRIPASLKAFLLAFAAVDDVGGILVIALFYGHGIAWGWLAAAGAVTATLLLLGRTDARAPWLYGGLALLLWASTALSGVHVTIAGVVLGLVLPARPLFDREEAARRVRALAERLDRGPTSRDALLGAMEELVARTEAPAERAARGLRPWVSYVVLPVFGLAMAGTALDPAALRDAVSSTAAQAIAVALVLGKPVGVLAATGLAVALGWARLPAGVGWRHIAGVATLSGIGFTVSLFIAKLAFGPEALASVRVAILGSSLLAGLGGLGILALASRRR
ncbi:MAG: Na+/H+ antiporter NhaA [Gemmatimonadetes bacterium]|nr:Na+/H+ antiporter NhaA [Gemmatimonadota bacterium]